MASSDSSYMQPEGDIRYSAATFSRFKRQNKGISTPDDLLPVFYALQRYCEQRPNDAAGLHLYGLVCECLHMLDRAVILITQTISILESAYEESEDAAIERQFIIAHANMGRLHLSLHDYASASESFESAFGLLPETDEDEESSALRSRIHYGMGLASFKSGAMQEGLDSLELAAQASDEEAGFKAQVMVVLAQVMWAIGTYEFKETAKNHLLEW